MFKVIKIELTEDGAETRYIKFRSKRVDDCWNYLINNLIHPLKDIREDAKTFFVFDEFDRMIPYVPHYVKRLM